MDELVTDDCPRAPTRVVDRAGRFCRVRTQRLIRWHGRAHHTQLKTASGPRRQTMATVGRDIKEVELAGR